MLKQPREYENFFKKIKQNAKICIYGSNNTAEKIFNLLKTTRSDITIKFFIDSKKEGNICGIPVYLVENVASIKKDIDTVIIASYSARYYLEVILKGFGIENIVIPDKKIFLDLLKKDISQYDEKKAERVFSTSKDRKLFRLVSKSRQYSRLDCLELKRYYDDNYKERYNGKVSLEHYFEFINKDAIKTTIDAGGYDGFTALTFTQRFPNTEKTYVFEPCYDDFKNNIIDKIIQNNDKIEIIQEGLWKDIETLEFREETKIKAGSGFIETKPNINRPHKIIKITTNTIDNFASNRNIKVDFIKMDVENAEINALIGAKETLIKDRPQLAISIYHSNEQFYNIPIILNEWLKDYNFRLGHYTDCLFDTVLYAIPKELA